jgi:hypothetical protein
MPVVKTVHHGGIEHNGKLAKVFAKSSRPELVKELNSWFFDYFYANKEKVRQLPPLDDWTHSTEDATYWYIGFPEGEWKVWISWEPVEFK